MNPQRPLAAELWTENCLKSVVSKNKRLLLGNEGLNQKSVRKFYAYIISEHCVKNRLIWYRTVGEEGFCVTIVPSRNRRNFHISEFLEETTAPSVVKFCTRITEVTCYKFLIVSNGSSPKFGSRAKSCHFESHLLWHTASYAYL